ncbi:MAG: SDR family oxidoreductase [Bacteroidales bacterium]|nr:SDR family oxidoreductase [Bacteroidales bacterium]
MMKKVVLITGVSSGFGKETARILAEKGHTVYGTIRRDCGVPDSVRALRLDLTDEHSIKEAVESVLKAENRIDVLINNAGMHSGGAIEMYPVDLVRLHIETNIMGTVSLTRKVLPQMRKQGGGMIINISSIGGLMGLPFQGYYSAVKFALEGISDALRMEVSGFNIKVIVINPGDFNTNNSFGRHEFLPPETEHDPYAEQFERTLGIIERDETNGRDPKILAKKIARIVECKNPRQRYIIASFKQKLAVLLKFILPGKLFRKILEMHYKIR